NFTCRVVGAGSPSTGGSSAEQGKHSACTFVGRAIQFAPGGNGSQTDIYTIVGRRLTPDVPPKVVSTIAEAKPTTLSNLSVDRKFLASDVEVYDVQNATDSAAHYAG